MSRCSFLWTNERGLARQFSTAVCYCASLQGHVEKTPFSRIPIALYSSLSAFAEFISRSSRLSGTVPIVWELSRRSSFPSSALQPERLSLLNCLPPEYLNSLAAAGVFEGGAGVRGWGQFLGERPGRGVLSPLMCFSLLLPFIAASSNPLPSAC